MNPLRLFCLLLLVALAGCDGRQDFLEYDNKEEVIGFRERKNERVLDELEKKKEELTRQLDEPGEEDRDKLEEDLTNTNRRLGSPEFFTYDATMEDLPEDLVWEEGLDQPELGSSRAKKGGTFNTYFSGLSFPPTIRPIGKSANNSFRSEHWDNIEMALVSLHPNTMETIPGLADRWAVGKDGRTVYFRINEKARWSDGNPVTVEDFFMTFHVCLSEYVNGPWYRQYYGTMFENITRYDDRHLSVRLANKKPKPEYYASLTPYSRVFYSEFGPDFEKRYNWRVRPTTGAYQILEENVVKGQSITLSRVKDWWARDQKYYRNRFNVDRIKYKVVRNLDKVFELFKKGEVDMFHLSSKRWYEDMEIPDVFDGYIEKKTFYNLYPRVPRGLYINHSRPFLGDVNVRIGLQHATNWQKVIDIDLRGDAGRLNIYNEGYGQFSNPEIVARVYSPEKAREAFGKAGFTKQDNDGVLQNDKGEKLSFSITYTKNPVADKRLQRLKEEALEAGLEYRLDGIDGTASYEKVMEKKHDLTFWGWGTQPPFPRYFEGIHSSNAYDPGTTTPRVQTNNISVYANPAADPLAEGIRFATTEKEIREMAWELEQILHDTAFWIPGYKNESYRLGHWRWMQWPDDFNVKMTREAQESYVYWIDVEEKEKTLRARSRSEAYPEVDEVYDQYQVK
ncbi:MAG: ABC transporter substrate-binding protein [Roseibacillus sp.]|nr:ABC transporter substrate-binding protein [Roseibacillus sp.]